MNLQTLITNLKQDGPEILEMFSCDELSNMMDQVDYAIMMEIKCGIDKNYYFTLMECKYFLIRERSRCIEAEKENSLETFFY